MGNPGRTPGRTDPAHHTVKGFFGTFLQFPSLGICNVLHGIETLGTAFGTGPTPDALVDFRIQLHHDLFIDRNLAYVINLLYQREKWKGGHIHIFPDLGLAGQTGL